MLTPDTVRKCVAFLGYEDKNVLRMAGSVFFLGREIEPGRADIVYAVTALHVINGIRSKGSADIHIRYNNRSDDAEWISTPAEQWFSHPTDSSIDVAILRITLPRESDHLVWPYRLCGTEHLLKINEVGLGDEVFITGLFSNHHGKRRNIPIVRVGNIACFAEEKVYTKSFGAIDAHLIEARSTGGLSGSPVILNLGNIRMNNGVVKTSAQPILLLFGLIHGHYDSSFDSVKPSEVDMLETVTSERINTGIAIVVPFHKIDEVITEYEKREPKVVSSA